MGLFKRRSEDPAEMERLRTGLGELRERLDESDAAKVELASKIRSLTERLETPITAPPPEPPTPSSPPPVAAAELEAVRAQIARLTVRLEALDRRITTISTELANQLGELSDDIDTLGKRTEADAIDEATLVALRDAQTRLAGEQARYQIAFRQDLAEIAERWRERRLGTPDPVTGSRRSEAKTRFGSRRRQPLRLPLTFTARRVARGHGR